MAENKFTSLPCTEFLQQLASKSPVPGGGGAAALAGATGAALGGMVCSLTLGKKKYAAVQDEVAALQQHLTELRERLLALAERDAEVFAPLAACYSMPTETPEQRSAKERAMSAALTDAVAVPLEIMELCAAALPLIDRTAAIGSALAVSDAGCAAAICKAALQSAYLNVLINTKSMTDRGAAEALSARAEALLAGGDGADATFAAVRARLV